MITLAGLLSVFVAQWAATCLHGVPTRGCASLHTCALDEGKNLRKSAGMQLSCCRHHISSCLGAQSWEDRLPRVLLDRHRWILGGPSDSLFGCLQALDWELDDDGDEEMLSERVGIFLSLFVYVDVLGRPATCFTSCLSPTGLCLWQLPSSSSSGIILYCRMVWGDGMARCSAIALKSWGCDWLTRYLSSTASSSVSYYHFNQGCCHGTQPGGS